MLVDASAVGCENPDVPKAAGLGESASGGVCGMREILVCEIWCDGFEHVDGNAALLRTINLVSPQASLLFLSEPAHGELVRRRLSEAGPCPISWHASAVPRRSVAAVRIFLNELMIGWRILSLARQRSSSAVVFCCLKASSLLAINTLIRLRRFDIPTLGVVHGELSMLLTKPVRRPWNRAISFHNVLKGRFSDRLRLIVLGESIEREVVRLRPDTRDLWRSMELLGYLPGIGFAGDAAARLEEPIRFGFLGDASKGFPDFCRVARTVRSTSSNAIFEMVGFLGRLVPPDDAEQFVEGISKIPLTPDQFRQGISRLDYCVGVANPDQYSLTGSGTFVDSLAWGKPYIALRNTYLTYYFKRMGDIGYLCDSVEQMCDCIRRIIADPPRERYARQVDNIVRGREIFAPESVAPKLRQIISEMAALGS